MGEGNGRGFAGMPPEKQRLIASMGGRRAHELGVAHTFTTDEARKAGRKGGKTSRRKSITTQNISLELNNSLTEP